MGLFKQKDPPPPPQFNPNNQFDQSRTAATGQLGSYTPLAYQRAQSYFQNLDAGGAQRDQTLLDPASNAARLAGASIANKMRTARGGAAAFGRNYADPNLAMTQDEEAGRQQEQTSALDFMKATGDTYNRNLGLLQQGDQMKQQALADILNSDTSRANANQQGMNSAYAAWLNRPQRPSLFGRLLGGALTVAGGALGGPLGAAAGGALGGMFGGGSGDQSGGGYFNSQGVWSGNYGGPGGSW